MDNISRLAKEEFASRLGRELTDEEAAEHAMHLRRFAAFLIDCAKDTVLMEKLGVKREGEASAAPRAADNTTQNDGKPLQMRSLPEVDPPTASSRDALPHRDSSAVAASASPAGPAVSLPQPVTTGAPLDGSQ